MARYQQALRLGMVGGGPGAFIGPAHRMAAELDGNIRLVAGAFASTPERSREGGQIYRVDASRTYDNYQEMIEKEATRPDGIEVVSIVTPNHLHLPVARDALEAGLHVISDKPATANLHEAVELGNIVRESGMEYALTFTYTGYPLVREAREIVRGGKLGIIRKVFVEYLQGWLSQRIESTGQKQAAWRADPLMAGIGGCISDIGVHAFNLLEYVTGLRVQQIAPDLRTAVAGRELDDDCVVLGILEQGARALISVSQIATGERNRLRLSVFGEAGGLHWDQESPSVLHIRYANGTEETVHSGSSQLSAPAVTATRLPVGHPEGLIEALATIYSDFARTIRSVDEASRAENRRFLCGIDDALRSMTFVDRAVHAAGPSWIPFTTEGGA